MSSFELQKRPKDPLFFVKVGNGIYYLVHKWGNDLSVFRRVLPILANPIFGLLLTFITLILSIHFLAAAPWNISIGCSSIIMMVVCFLTVVINAERDLQWFFNFAARLGEYNSDFR